MGETYHDTILTLPCLFHLNAILYADLSMASGCGKGKFERVWTTAPALNLENRPKSDTRTPWYPKSNYLVLISTHRKVFPKASIAMSKSRYPHLCAGELQQAQFIQHGQQIHQVANFDVTSVEAQWMFWCQRYDVPQLSTWIIYLEKSFASYEMYLAEW